MKIFAVIDTNVLVSALIKWSSVPGRVMVAALFGAVQPMVHEEILAEYHNMLQRNKFHFDPEAVELFIEQLRLRAISVGRTASSKNFIDSDDKIFYEATLGARELGDAYLVTGNTRHFPHEPFVVTPRQMLSVIE